MCIQICQKLNTEVDPKTWLRNITTIQLAASTVFWVWAFLNTFGITKNPAKFDGGVILWGLTFTAGFVTLVSTICNCYAINNCAFWFALGSNLTGAIIFTYAAYYLNNGLMRRKIMYPVFGAIWLYLAIEMALAGRGFWQKYGPKPKVLKETTPLKSEDLRA